MAAIVLLSVALFTIAPARPGDRPDEVEVVRGFKDAALADGRWAFAEHEGDGGAMSTRRGR